MGLKLAQKEWPNALVCGPLSFDLATDPYELNNLAYSKPDLCAEMRQSLLSLLQETREPFFEVLINHGVPCRWDEPLAGSTGLVLVATCGRFYRSGQLDSPKRNRNIVAIGFISCPVAGPGTRWIAFTG